MFNEGNTNTNLRGVSAAKSSGGYQFSDNPFVDFFRGLFDQGYKEAKKAQNEEQDLVAVPFSYSQKNSKTPNYGLVYVSRDEAYKMANGNMDNIKTYGGELMDGRSLSAEGFQNEFNKLKNSGSNFQIIDSVTLPDSEGAYRPGRIGTGMSFSRARDAQGNPIGATNYLGGATSVNDGDQMKQLRSALVGAQQSAYNRSGERPNNATKSFIDFWRETRQGL